MAHYPGLGYKIIATVTDVKGECSAGHRVGESFEISCHNPSDLCGFFYHHIFPNRRLSSSEGICPGGKETPYNCNARIALT
jgi:uncharacterized repeat protein (TIGR04076 family)